MALSLGSCVHRTNTHTYRTVPSNHLTTCFVATASKPPSLALLSHFASFLLVAPVRRASNVLLSLRTCQENCNYKLFDACVSEANFAYATILCLVLLLLLLLLAGYSKFCENLISIGCDRAQVENHFISLQCANLYASAKSFVYGAACFLLQTFPFVCTL